MEHRETWDINILAETPDYLVINKPSGLVVHADGRSNEYTLVNWIQETYPETSGVGEMMIIEHKGEQITIERPGIVHRLDRETSGVMVIAKTQTMYECLKQQFANHTISKKYTALIAGWPKATRGIIDVPIGRSTTDIRKWTADRSARGKLRDAVTRYVVTNQYSDHDEKRFARVDLYPETGRTHQLRVHMKHLGYPIIGDELYGAHTVGIGGAERCMLHALQLQFTDLNNQVITTIAPLPADFRTVISNGTML